MKNSAKRLRRSKLCGSLRRPSELLRPSGWGRGIAPKDGWKLSEEAARKALVLDEFSAGRTNALATKLMYYDWDWAGAEREIQIGIESDQHYAELHTFMRIFSHTWDVLMKASRRRTVRKSSIPRGNELLCSVHWDLAGVTIVMAGVGKSFQVSSRQNP